MSATHLNVENILLPIGRYRARFRVDEPVRLPPYPGSAWRGAFGHALKRALCVTRAPECSGCLLFRSCGYAYVFETPPPALSAKMRKYPAAPHPFVLDLDLQGGELTPGSTYALGFTLIGRGNQHLPYMIYALEQAGAQGVGQGRGRLSLECVEQHDAAENTWIRIYTSGEHCEPRPITVPIIPELPHQVRLVLETPLRLKRDAGIVGVDDFSFGALFSRLLRRISMLTYFHTDTPLETDFASLTHAAREIPHTDASLRWFDWARYSSRQKREMALGGLLGEFTLDGALIEPFWPYLWLGQYVHAGAVTSMGLGRYRIETAASLPSRTELDASAENVRP